MYQTDKTPAEHGIALARTLKWDGESIFIAAIAALTDSNFHKESIALLRTWEKLTKEQKNHVSSTIQV